MVFDFDIMLLFAITFRFGCTFIIGLVCKRVFISLLAKVVEIFLLCQISGVVLYRYEESCGKAQLWFVGIGLNLAKSDKQIY